MRTTRDSGVLWLTFDRPEKKNAFTGQMYTDLAQAIVQANTDNDVRVVVLTGEGGTFTAGNDLGDFLERAPKDESAPVFEFLRAISTFEKPLMAVVEGPAVGIGTTMLLHCDVVLAAQTAKFSLPFVNLGLCPEGASSLLLPQSAGWARACELLLFGEPFDSATAEAAGLVTRVVADADLKQVAQERANTLAQKPLASLMATKRLLRQGSRASVAQALCSEGKEFLERLVSPEAKSALNAFLQRKSR
jgi:enoyl-CoA hydratase/carnithine racemase